jgi:hypothetical protein
MSQQVSTWIKHVSGMEDADVMDAERLTIRQENHDTVIFEFWDYEGKRGEITVPANTAIVLARSILLCVEGSLGEITVNL